MSNEYQKKYYQKNRERLLKMAKQRYEENQDECILRERNRRKLHGKEFNRVRQEKFAKDPKRHEAYKQQQHELYLKRKQKQTDLEG